MDVRCKGLFLPGYDSPEDAFEGLDASAHPDHHFKSFHMNLRKLISAIQILFSIPVRIWRGDLCG